MPPCDIKVALQQISEITSCIAENFRFYLLTRVPFSDSILVLRLIVTLLTKDQKMGYKKLTAAEAKAAAKIKIDNAMAKILDAFQNPATLAAALASMLFSTGGRHVDSYSWMNRLLVALAGYTDAMGFGQWIKVGRCVRKGQKSVTILRPAVITEEKNGEKKTKVVGYRPVAVFGIEQTDIVNPEKWAKHNKGGEAADKNISDKIFLNVAHAWNLTVTAIRGVAGRAQGWYSPNGKAIALAVENDSTWAHELIHAADDRNGKLIERGQHWRSETVAELGGAVLLLASGYETEADLGGAYKYINHYAKSAGIGIDKACKDVLKRTCEAVMLVLEESDKLMAPSTSDSVLAVA